MRLRCRAAIPGLFVVLTLAAAAGADDSPTSVVWYRASDECPSGAEFLGRLANAAARVRLADAGDHIDFIVTLVAARGATLGRLERQTQSGTVAIRELRDVSCARVADALALSLGLTIGPAQPASTSAPSVPPAAVESPAPDESTVAGPAESAPPPSAVSAAVPPAAAPPTPLRGARSVAPTPGEDASVRPALGWSVGLNGGVLLGVAPSALPRVAAFVDVAPALSQLASDLSFRFAVVGALGSTATDVGPVQQWILAGRFDVSPWRWGGPRLGFRPSVGLELGATGASQSSQARPSRERASSLWLAPSLGMRGTARLGARLSLELGADALLPLSRSEVTAGAVRLYRTDLVAFSGYLGFFVGPF